MADLRVVVPLYQNTTFKLLQHPITREGIENTPNYGRDVIQVIPLKTYGADGVDVIPVRYRELILEPRKHVEFRIMDWLRQSEPKLIAVIRIDLVKQTGTIKLNEYYLKHKLSVELGLNFNNLQDLPDDVNEDL